MKNFELELLEHKRYGSHGPWPGIKFNNSLSSFFFFCLKNCETQDLFFKNKTKQNKKPNQTKHTYTHTHPPIPPTHTPTHTQK